MSHTPGQIAEYGTQEFNNNQSVYTILESGIYTNSCGIQFKTDLYHRTEGYKNAGSCAIWTSEVCDIKFISQTERLPANFPITDKRL